MNATVSKSDRMLNTAPSQLVIRLSVPATAALLISSAGGIFDAWFISTLGNAASGAVGIAFAVVALIQAIGYTLGTGAGSLVSRALGAADQNRADLFASVAFYLSLALGGLITLAGFLFGDPIIRILGASESIFPYAKAYCRFLFPAAPLMCGVFVLNNLLRSEGAVRYAMFGMIAGNLVNVALDPLFLFRMKMGISGAALALLLSQCVSFFLLLLRYLSRKTKVSLLPKKAICSARQLWELLAIGSPSLFRQGLAGVSSALMLRQARTWGDSAAAAVSVNARIFLFLYSFCLGIGQGLMPAAGFNQGAKRPDRVLALSRFALILATALMFVLSIPTAVFAPYLIAKFRPDPEVIRTGAIMLRAQCAVFFLHGIIAVTNMLLQALGKAFPAVLIAASRQGICFIPMVLFLPRLFGLTGLCLSQAVADVLTFLLTLPFLIHTMKSFRSEKIQHPQT